MTNADKSFHIALTGDLHLKPMHHEDLPELPEGTPTPTVSLDFNDGAWTYLELNGESVHFWTEDHEGTQNSWNNEKISSGGEGPWEGTLTDEQIEAVLEWGAKVHERVDCFTYTVMLEAAKENVQALMLAIATDNPNAANIPGVTVTAA